MFGYAVSMKTEGYVLIFCLVAIAAGLGPYGCASAAVSTSSSDAKSTPQESAHMERTLSSVIAGISPISSELRARRNIAQATFCLPQNVLGILLYGALQLCNAIEDVGQVNEVTVVVSRWLIGVSLGRYIFLPTSFLTEQYVRHEYGHTLQGYEHGPFFLLLEGSASLIQAIISVFSPTYASRYYERWPEDEANALGGVN